MRVKVALLSCFVAALLLIAAVMSSGVLSGAAGSPPRLALQVHLPRPAARTEGVASTRRPQLTDGAVHVRTVLEWWSRGAWRADDARGAATRYAWIDPKSRERERFFWAPPQPQPAGVPALADFDRVGFCAALRGRHVYLAGDSIHSQLHDALQLLASDGTGVFEGRNKSWGTAVWRATACEGGGAPIRLPFLNVKALPLRSGDVPGALGVADFLEAGATAGWPPGVIVLNRGAHFQPTPAVLQSAAAVLDYVAAAFPDALVVWRNTPAGHANCTAYTAPVATPQDPAHLPWDWGKFAEQNRAVQELLAARGRANEVYLDVAAPTALRPDRHSGSRDCLHYRHMMPNPVDHWVRLLYNVLLLTKATAPYP